MFDEVFQEEGVVDGVTFEKAAWLAGETVEPEDAAFSHPAWGVAFRAGVDIEGEADGENGSGVHLGLISVGPRLLFRGAEADPEAVWAGAVDVGVDLGFAALLEVAVMGADDF